MRKIFKYLIFSLLLLTTTFTLFSCQSTNVDKDDDKIEDNNNSGNGDKDDPTEENPDSNTDDYPTTIYNSNITNYGKVGYEATYLGTVERKLPDISNEGLLKYPEYGVKFTGPEEEKQAILAESDYLIASNNTYNKMDKDGNLYLNDKKLDRKLYKHSASINMYEGSISDDEEAVIKKISINAFRSKGNYITGLYAPAGEVVKINISEEDLKTTGGLKIYIGQVLTDGGQNNIWLARDFVRMPKIANVMEIKETEGYVGSFLGGPIYVEPINKNVKFSVTISGACKYSHFILGYTTPEEFALNNTSTAPYFDLEVFDDGVRHSGPKQRTVNYNYNDLTKAAILWEKIALVSNQVPSGSPGNTGITFLYDPFIAAGSMVAFVGRYTVNCPLSCLTDALNYDMATTNASDGFWGCVHEFNHHFQKYGFAPGDEVTNNAVSLVSYSLFTTISSNRNLDNTNEGNYKTGWNRYTNPSWSLKQTLNNQEKNQNLDSYANILHSFGQDIFIKAAAYNNGSGGVDNWFKALCETTHYNMAYYFTEVLHQTVSSDLLNKYQNYPMYILVASIYQTGSSYSIDNKTYYSNTASPYNIPKDEDFKFDLTSSIVLPKRFTFNILSITNPTTGSLVKNSDGTYTFKPLKNNLDASSFKVSLEIIDTLKQIPTQTKELVISFKPANVKANILERTYYLYDKDSIYNDIASAYNNNFVGFKEKIVEDNINRVQNSNSEVWEPKYYENAFVVVEGKIKITETAKYRIALRGRQYASLYLSYDNNDYFETCNLVNLNHTSNFDLTNKDHYYDLDLKKNDYVYFKAVLLLNNSSNYIGVGIGKFNGDTVDISYLNAYRNNYEELNNEVVSDYFYKRNYTYDYVNTSNNLGEIVDYNYKEWDNNYSINNLIDNNHNNFIHSNKENISIDNPFSITVDLKENITANQIVIYGEPTKLYLPKTLKLYLGNDINNLELVLDIKEATKSGNNIVLNFNEKSFRYYKLVVTDTYQTSQSANKYIAYREIKFNLAYQNGTLLSPDTNFLYQGDFNIVSGLAEFGHYYVGQNSTITYDFKGSKFLVLGKENYNYKDLEIIIDDKVININKETTDNILYLSEDLENTSHKIVIRSKNEFYFNALVIW